MAQNNNINKFDIGDKVRIVNVNKRTNAKLYKHKGKVVQISHKLVDKYNNTIFNVFYRVNEIHRGDYWSEKYFEKVNDREKITI